ncbi:MAG: DsrE family protein [Gammaproteobacteria bacterium]
MKNARNSLVLVSVATATALLAAWLGTSNPRNSDAEAPAAAFRQPAAALPADALPAPERRPVAAGYYFDVTGHSADELRALLERAAAVHAATPAVPGEPPAVVLVLHGPDVEYFARHNAARHGDIVARAAALDAAGVLDFKMCAATAARRGIDASEVPPFIELVPWAGDEIERLQQAGYVRL